MTKYSKIQEFVDRTLEGHEWIQLAIEDGDEKAFHECGVYEEWQQILWDMLVDRIDFNKKEQEKK